MFMQYMQAKMSSSAQKIINIHSAFLLEYSQATTQLSVFFEEVYLRYLAIFQTVKVIYELQ